MKRSLWNKNLFVNHVNLLKVLYRVHCLQLNEVYSNKSLCPVTCPRNQTVSSDLSFKTFCDRNLGRAKHHFKKLSTFKEYLTQMLDLILPQQPMS